MGPPSPPKTRTTCYPCYQSIHLQSISEQLVHLGHLSRNTEIDSTITNLDNQSTLDIRVDLGHDLEFLALADILGFGDCGFEAGKGAVVEGLYNVSISFFKKRRRRMYLLYVYEMRMIKERKSYSSTRNHQLNLPTIRTHQHTKLLTHTLQNRQTVIIRQRDEQILNHTLLIRTSNMLLQLGNDLLFIARTKRRRTNDFRELGIFLEHGGERVQGFGCRF